MKCVWHGLALGVVLLFAFRSAAGTGGYGACAHVTRDEFAERERAFSMMRAAGIESVRCDFDMWRCRPTAKGGAWNFSYSDPDAVQIDTAKRLIHFTRVGGGGNRTLHCRPIDLSVHETRKFETSLPGKITWGCYDADRVDNRPDPTNKWMKLAFYHNDVATISPDGVLTALKSGESVVVALAKNGDKEFFPVSVETAE